jgi:thermitase
MHSQTLLSGLIPIPLLLILGVLGAAGSFVTSKVPEMVKNRENTKIVERSSIPIGTAVSGDIIVGFKKSTTTAIRDSSHTKRGSKIKRRNTKIDIDTVHIPAGSTIDDVMTQYASDAHVAYVEPNFIATALAVPNDPMYGNQWNLAKIHAAESFDTAHAGSTIAVIDTGVDSTHPDMSGEVLTGYNAITGSTNTMDDNGHGTHVAGIAAAITDNGTGLASVAYRAQILPLKALDSAGSGTYSDIIESIVYAADHGARVINLSLAGTSASEALRQAIVYAQNKGSIIVAAAGNSGNDIASYPGAYDGVIEVSASDQSDAIANFSNFGTNIFAAAPGVSIESSLPGATYGTKSGTSMAAPHVAGLLSLLTATKPSASNTDILAALSATSDKVGSIGYDSRGWNPYFGFGRINAQKAVAALLVAPSPTPASSPTATIAPTPTSSPSPTIAPSPTSAVVPTIKAPTPTASSVRIPTTPIGNVSPTLRTTAMPVPSPVSRKPHPTERYMLPFRFTGMIVRSTHGNEPLRINIHAGTPDVIGRLAGNVVEVHLIPLTDIRQDDTAKTPDVLLLGTIVEVSGTIRMNRLVGEKIRITKIPDPTPTAAPAFQPPEQKELQPGRQREDERHTEDISPLPVPTEDATPGGDRRKGRDVRGAATATPVGMFYDFFTSLFNK